MIYMQQCIHTLEYFITRHKNARGFTLQKKLLKFITTIVGGILNFDWLLLLCVHCKQCGVIYDTVKCLPHLIWLDCHFHSVMYYTNGVVCTLHFLQCMCDYNILLVTLATGER